MALILKLTMLMIACAGVAFTAGSLLAQIP